MKKIKLLLALALAGCGGAQTPINAEREGCWREAQDAFLERTEDCETDECVDAEKGQLKFDQEKCP